ncbi:hypothetical protein CRYUN_Cryun27aG0018300 [Craigia yunnanensis]
MLMGFKLEQESKVFFNMFYFGENIINGELERAEKYLSAFTRSYDNEYSCMSFLKLQNQKHRENRQPSWNVTAASEKANLLDELKTLMKKNPKLQEKLVLPRLNGSALFHLMRRISPSPEKNFTSFKAEKYLSAFTNGNDEWLAKMFYEMRKHEYLDAEDCNEHVEMENVLLRDLKAFSGSNSKILNELRKELSLESFSMAWWVPYRVNLTNQIISFENIPTVPYLCPTSPIIIESTSEGGSLQETNDYGAGVSTHLVDVHSVAGVNQIEKSTTWKLKEINEPSECRILILPDSLLAERVVRLIYSYSGDFLLALAEDAKHKLWTWKHSTGKASVNVQPQLYQPCSGMTMTNEMGAPHQNQCFALNDSYLFSASGGKISVFCLDTFKKLATFGEPPLTCTYFTFFNKHNSAVGFNDSSILIRCLRNKKNQVKLEGHRTHISCLAFSHSLNVLVSAGADAQLCVWNANGWEKLASKFLCSLCNGHVTNPPGVNFIQFHQDQVHLLAVHERLIDIYEAPILNHVLQWVPMESDLPITSATYSSNGQLIYVSFKTGCIKVLVSATLDVRCQINLTAYAQPCTSLQVYPLVIAAHPSNANQIALGLSNDMVNVFEPLESEEWGEPPPPRDARSKANGNG